MGKPELGMRLWQSYLLTLTDNAAIPASQIVDDVASSVEEREEATPQESHSLHVYTPSTCCYVRCIKLDLSCRSDVRRFQ